MKIAKVSLLFIFTVLSTNTFGARAETVIREVTIQPEEIKRSSVFNWGNHAYSYHGPIVKRSRPDSHDNRKASKLRLFENGRPLGPPHSTSHIIKTKGSGAYKHWYGGGDRRYAPPYLIFTTSDNSDPRINGRVYTIKAPVKVYRLKLPKILKRIEP